MAIPSKCISDLCVQKEATLWRAMEVIDYGGCEFAMVVDHESVLLGILTDGDLRRALLSGASLQEPLEKYMKKNFTFVKPSSGRAEILDIMRARTLKQIPVIDDQGRLIGLHLLREMVGAVPRGNWAVIMAGGRGDRLRPLTDKIPKPMIKVAGRPILERIILHLVGFGIRKIFISVNYLGDMIEKYFGDGDGFGCEIVWLHENQPLGTGGGLSLLPQTPVNPLLVLNGDLVTQFDVESMLAFHSAHRLAATVAVHEYTHTVPYGTVEVGGDRILSIREKPTHSWLASAGIYILDPELLGRVPRDTWFPMPALIEDCIRRGDPVGSFDIAEEWQDVGRHAELSRARGEAQEDT